MHMKLPYWNKAYRPWFRTRRLAVRSANVLEPWFGLFVPGVEADTILVNAHLCTTEALVRGTLLHELIHAEQHALDMPLDHGAYFTHRQQELAARTGLPI